MCSQVAAALVAALAGCGAPPAAPGACPPGERISSWVVRDQDRITASGCGSVAEVRVAANTSVALVRGYAAAPNASVSLSADVAVLSGAGEVNIAIWGGSAAISSAASTRIDGSISARLPSGPDRIPSPAGALELSIYGVADPQSDFAFRISDVRIN